MNKVINVLITGDTHLGGGRVKELALENSMTQLFGSFLKKIQQADLSITNFESPLIEDGNPILKTGPNINSPARTVEVLKRAGFNLLTLANNHIMDYDEEGLESTLRFCSKAGLETVGAGSNSEEAEQSYSCEIRGIRISVINIAENEFGTTKSESPGAHALDPVQNYYRIREASQNTDFVFVIVHGGHENYPLPSPRMKQTYRFFADAGADAVVGHHPHCYSGYEVYNDVPIFYSLGNFLFDKGKQTSSPWNEGYMVEFKIEENSLNFEVLPYIQNAKKAGLRRLGEDEKLRFENQISQLNDIIADDEELKNRFDEFCESSRNLYTSYIEPHSLRYLHALRNRGLFPSLMSKRKKRLLLNLTRCEAHRDVLLNILEP